MTKKKGTPGQSRRGGTEQCTSNSTPKGAEDKALASTNEEQPASAVPAYDATQIAQRLYDFIGHTS